MGTCIVTNNAVARCAYSSSLSWYRCWNWAIRLRFLTASNTRIITTTTQINGPSHADPTSHSTQPRVFRWYSGLHAAHSGPYEPSPHSESFLPSESWPPGQLEETVSVEGGLASVSPVARTWWVVSHSLCGHGTFVDRLRGRRKSKPARFHLQRFDGRSLLASDDPLGFLDALAVLAVLLVVIVILIASVARRTSFATGVAIPELGAAGGGRGRAGF